jgi:anti-sigma B factor antagonist
MDGALDIAIRTERGVVIAAVTGEIDISTVAQLRERLYELADHGGTLIVDLNRVTFIDSVGLGALVGTAQRAAEHGGSLHAVCAQPQPRRLLWMTGVDKRIPLWATMAGALMFQEASQRSSDSGLISRRPYRSGSALPGGGLAHLEVFGELAPGREGEAEDMARSVLGIADHDAVPHRRLSSMTCSRSRSARRRHHGDPHADRPGPAGPGRALVGRVRSGWLALTGSLRRSLARAGLADADVHLLLLAADSDNDRHAGRAIDPVPARDGQPSAAAGVGTVADLGYPAGLTRRTPPDA